MPAANRLLAMEEGDLDECERIVRSRKTAVNIAKRAQMLVLAARGLSNRQIALDLGANEHVVGRVRKEYRQRGLAVLEDRARPGRPRSRACLCDFGRKAGLLRIPLTRPLVSKG